MQSRYIGFGRKSEPFDEPDVRLWRARRVGARRALAAISRNPEAFPVARVPSRSTSFLAEPRSLGSRREAEAKGRSEMAPQRLEKIESAPGNGMGSDGSNLQHLVHGHAADRGSLGVTGVAKNGA